MKILQLIDSLAIGGAERMSVNMSNVFTDNGIENILVCSRKKGPLSQFLPDSVKCVQLEKRFAFDIIALFFLIRIVKKEKPTVLHAHSTSIFWGAVVKMFFPKIKLVWHDHNGNRKFEKNLWLKVMLIFSNGVVAVSQDLLEWSKYENPRKKVALIRNFPYLKINPRIRKNNTKNVVLHLANLRHPKDHLTLVEAVKILKERNTCEFQVCCAGNDYNDAYSEAIKKKIVLYGLENEIVLLGAVQNTKDLLEKASLALLCSESEGLPVSLLEYGLAALPVVVTDVGQCGEVLKSGKYGILIPKSSPLELANALEYLMLNRDKSVQLGYEFKEHVEKQYGSSCFLAEYRIFINDLC